MDRLRFRLPDPGPSPVGLANAGFPPWRGRRFFLGLGEEGGGPIYRPGSRLDVVPRHGFGLPETPNTHRRLFSNISEEDTSHGTDFVPWAPSGCEHGVSHVSRLRLSGLIFFVTPANPAQQLPSVAVRCNVINQWKTESGNSG